MQIETNIKLHNNFQIRVTDQTEDEERVYRVENVVLNQFYTRMFSSNNGIDKIFVGEGSNPPQPTDTALQTQITSRGAGITWNRSNVTVGGSGVITCTGSIRLEAHEFVGRTIREVGLGGTALCTRAILQDANGNPLELLKTDTMIIDIYATAFIELPEYISGYPYYASSSPALSTSHIDFLTLLHSVTFMNRRLGRTWKEGPSFPSFWPNNQVYSSEFTANVTTDAPNKKKTYTISAITAGQVNIGGIREIRIGSIYIPVPNSEIIQPPINKEVLGTADGVKKGFSTKFGWIRNNGTFKLYINDIEQNGGYSVRFDSPAVETAMSFLEASFSTSGGTSHRQFFKKVYPLKITDVYLVIKYAGDVNNFTLYFSDIEGVNQRSQSFSFNVAGWYPISLINQESLYIGGTTWISDYTFAYKFRFESEIVFETPPPAGAIITATYQPDCIAKDDTKIINNMSYAFSI